MTLVKWVNVLGEMALQVGQCSWLITHRDDCQTVGFWSCSGACAPRDSVTMGAYGAQLNWSRGQRPAAHSPRGIYGNSRYYSCVPRILSSVSAVPH